MTQRDILKEMQAFYAKSPGESEPMTTIYKSKGVGMTTERLRELSDLAEASPTLDEIGRALGRHMYMDMLIGDVRHAERLAVIRDQLVTLLQEPRQ